MQRVEGAEEALGIARKHFEEHFEDYEETFEEYKELYPDQDTEVLERAYGPEYFKLGQKVTVNLIEAEVALKKSRIHAKKVGLGNVNSSDQESGFLTVDGEGPTKEDAQEIALSCDLKRIQAWMATTEAPTKLDPTEARFAFSGADVDTWDSVSSANRDRSKRRKIEHMQEKVIKERSARGASWDRWRNRVHARYPNEKPRARSEGSFGRRQVPFHLLHGRLIMLDLSSH